MARRPAAFPGTDFGQNTSSPVYQPNHSNDVPASATSGPAAAANAFGRQLTQLADEVIEKLKAYFPKRTAEPLALSVTIDEAQSHGKTIWEYAPWSRGATMLQSIAEAVDKAAR